MVAARCGWLALLATFLAVTKAAADTGQSIYREDGAGRRACVQCHGRDGRGGGEGRPPPPDITWRKLVSERGYRNPDDLAAAVSSGLAPDGRKLAMPVMPIEHFEAEALADYLDRIADQDALGSHAGEVTLAVGSQGEADPFPAMLDRALLRRTGGRAIFGWRFRLEPMTRDAVAALDPQARIFASVGLAEPLAAEAARALARAAIPNLMPRGFFIGFEKPEDGVGLYPTFSRILAAAEAASGCRPEEIAMQWEGGAEAERAARFLRIRTGGLSSRSVGPRPSCLIRLVTLSGGEPARVLLIGTEPERTEPRRILSFDPAAASATNGRAALEALAEISADRLFKALVAMRGQPGRASFLAAFRKADASGEAGGAVARKRLDFSYPNLSATIDVAFETLR